MNALTRFESTTPVRYDVMNDMCTEVEARDADLQEQINVLKPVRSTATIEYYNSWSAWAGTYGIKLDKIGNRVFCNGMLAVGVKDNGTLIFTVPEAFRPVETEPRLLSANDGTNQQITINTAGNVLVDTSASTGWNTSTATLLDFSCSWEV